jgi:hypothetical protein
VERIVYFMQVWIRGRNIPWLWLWGGGEIVLIRGGGDAIIGLLRSLSGFRGKGFGSRRVSRDAWRCCVGKQ